MTGEVTMDLHLTAEQAESRAQPLVSRPMRRRPRAAHQSFVRGGISGPPMTLGNCAARLVVWCRDCRHQVEPDPAAHAANYGAELPVIDCVKRLKCSALHRPTSGRL